MILPGICWDGADLLLRLTVQPNASIEGLVGHPDEPLKIKLKAMALEGQANTRLCQFLAQQFGVRLRQVILERGHRGRRKRLRILAPVQLPCELQPLLAKDSLS